ncbi:hypothetical protein BJ165DRAFT_1417498 [Panaeolus papilionaceus]|nr:hypothetical protein BJ165DRAFT_1417498 [Panaeolus papilionaceus]
MTLHLHFLLWIEGSLPLQEVRDKLMSGDSLFQQEIVSYLESCQVGEFFTGSIDHVRNTVPPSRSLADNTEHSYNDPTLTLPEAPPGGYCVNPDTCLCESCGELRAWYETFKSTVDDIMLRSNVHKCFKKRDNSDGYSENFRSSSSKEHATGKGCRDKNDVCTARFPRDIFPETTVDPINGHINMKKLEPWTNTITPTVTAVSRCNTDTTCLLSGTAVKATVGYVTDYLTKSSLKTYQGLYQSFKFRRGG